MARTVRKQPLVAKPPAKAPSFRPTGVAKPAKKPVEAGAAAAGGASAAPKRRGWLPQPVRDVISELKKVTWPTRQDTTRLSLAVIAVSIAMGLMLGGVDMVFNWLVDNTLLR